SAPRPKPLPPPFSLWCVFRRLAGRLGACLAAFRAFLAYITIFALAMAPPVKYVFKPIRSRPDSPHGHLKGNPQNEIASFQCSSTIREAMESMRRGRWAIPESSRTNADDCLPPASLGRV